MLQKGAGALLAKIDIQHAYCNVPIHPDDRWLLGMVWEESLFVDTALPFGLRSACKIFNAVADAVEWILKEEGVATVFHYLDDFLIIGAPHSDECARALSLLLYTFRELGLPIALNKLEGPIAVLSFLGLELNSNLLEVRLPAVKLAEIHLLISSWLGWKACTGKELKSLVGHLGFACKVVQPGKTFLRRMFELLSRANSAHRFIRLNSSFKSDLLWWHTFLSPLNGVNLTRKLTPPKFQVRFASDASGRVGCGAIWSPQWFQYKWCDYPDSMAVQNNEDSITLKELLPIVFACGVWGPLWQNSAVMVYCDNQGAVAVVNSGYSKVQAIMHLLRCQFFIRSRFNFYLRAVYLPGKDNVLADAIARDHLDVLFSQVPQAATNRAILSPQLAALLVYTQPDWTSPHWTHLFGSCFPPA